MSEGAPPARRSPGMNAPARGSNPSGPARDVGCKLVCEAGPRAGSEFPLREEETVIGRATEADISIPDTSVSRRHVVIKRVDGGYRVADLGSGNGTLVNDEPIPDEVPLHHGDRLTLGDTQLVFMDLANATNRSPVPSRPAPARPAPAAPSRTSGERVAAARPTRVRGRNAPAPASMGQKVSRLAAVALVTILVVFIAAALIIKKNRDANEAHRKAAVAAQLASLFQTASRLGRDGHWSQAKPMFEQIAAVDPNYPDLSDALQFADKEIPNEQALDQAQALLAKSHLGAAAAQLSKVSSDTMMFSQLGSLRNLLQTKIDAKVLQARTALETHQAQQALDLSADVLAAAPDNRDAKAVHEEADYDLALANKKHPKKRFVPTTPAEESVSRFVDGDVQGAIAVADSCARKTPKCRSLLQAMNEFAGLAARIDDLDAKGLAHMKSLENQITGGRGSRAGETAGARQANIFYRRAYVAKASGDYAHAVQYVRAALKADSSNSSARTLDQELRSMAKNTYLLGYMEKGSDPADAAIKFQQVLNMTLPGDEYHDKAQRQMDKLHQ